MDAPDVNDIVQIERDQRYYGPNILLVYTSRGKDEQTKANAARQLERQLQELDKQRNQIKRAMRAISESVTRSVQDD